MLIDAVRNCKKQLINVFGMPLTQMGRRHFLCSVGSIGTASVLKTDIPKGYLSSNLRHCVLLWGI